MKIIFWLLHPDPRSRAKLKDLQKDKWVNQPVDMSQYSFELVMGEYVHASFLADIVWTNEGNSMEGEGEEGGRGRWKAVHEHGCHPLCSS